MAIPDGAHYVPGTVRTFVRLGSGAVVPRQVAENMYARERGFNSDYERRKAYRASKKSAGYERDKGKARQQGLDRRQYDETRALYYADKLRNGNDSRQVDHSPNGPLARYLDAIGRRQLTPDYAVGDSPGIR